MKEGLAFEALKGPQAAGGGLAQKLDRKTFASHNMNDEVSTYWYM